VFVRPYILTGAGISLDSGIPTFRGNDPDAVWSKRALETGEILGKKYN